MISRLRLLLGAALALPLVLSACDGLPDTGVVGEVVVESYLRVGEPLAVVGLRRSVAFGSRTPVITDADVAVELLREDGSVEARYPYRLAVPDSGRYAPLPGAPLPRVLPLRRYRLVATVPGQATPVTSTTRTPSDFDFVSLNADTLAYSPTPGAPQFAVTVTRPTYPGRQAVFLFSTQTLLPAPTVADATPFFRAALDGDGDGQVDDPEDFDIPDLIRGSSPLLNEANYTRNANGTITIALPWIAVVFYGPNEISASSVDDNLNDFLRSLAVQQGGSTSSPGEILNILDRVEGGTGIFGSFSRVEARVFVAR